tara:strand:+ start:438 stop:1166 length:729 start_codon:yes stop_codon:yes gene_type:complete
MEVFNEQILTFMIVGFVIMYFIALVIKNAAGVAYLRNSSEKQKSLKVIDPHALMRVKNDIIRSCQASLPPAPRHLWLTGHKHIGRIYVGRINGLCETNSIRWITVNPTAVNFFNMFSIPLSRTRIIATHKEYCSHPTSPDVFIRATGVNLHADVYWVPSYIDKYDEPMSQETLLAFWEDSVMDWKTWMLRFQHLIQTDLGPRLLVRAMNPSIADRAKELYPAGQPRTTEVPAAVNPNEVRGK